MGDRQDRRHHGLSQLTPADSSLQPLLSVQVNVNPGYQSSELEYCLNLVGCHTLISFQRFKSTNYCQILESLEPNILSKAFETKVKGNYHFQSDLPLNAISTLKRNESQPSRISS